jgi:hypothetical protein
MGKIAILVGAGSSMDDKLVLQKLDELRKSNSVDVFAVGSGLSKLENLGITPDYRVATSPGHFWGYENLKEPINDGIPLLIPSTVTADDRTEFEKIYNKNLIRDTDLKSKRADIIAGNAAYEIVSENKVEEYTCIISVGNDLALIPKENSPTKGLKQTLEDLEKDAKYPNPCLVCKDLDKFSDEAKILLTKEISSKDVTLQDEKIFREEILSKLGSEVFFAPRAFKIQKDDIEKFVEDHPEIKYINASNGLDIKGTKRLDFVKAIETQLSLNKLQNVQHKKQDRGLSI